MKHQPLKAAVGGTTLDTRASIVPRSTFDKRRKWLLRSRLRFPGADFDSHVRPTPRVPSCVRVCTPPLRFLMPSPTVDRVMADARAASFATRSIKASAKLAGLRLALSMVDLTTLEGADSPERVRALCAKGVRPMSDDEAVLGERLPSVAAVCVYPSMVPVARDAIERLQVGGTGFQPVAQSDGEESDSSQAQPEPHRVRIASVATGFPSGQYSIGVRLRDVREAVAAGADEIDMVINRGAFLSGRYDKVADEIRCVVEACGEVHLKVILETGELETYDNVRRASDLAIEHIRDGDFIKTSTGKVQPAATMGVSLVMLEAIRDAAGSLHRGSHHGDTEAWSPVAPASSRSAQENEATKPRSDEEDHRAKVIGFKPAGGIRTAKAALHYLCMVKETVGGRWLTPELFRFGASSLVNDILRQLVKEKTGRYPAWHDFGDG